MAWPSHRHHMAAWSHRGTPVVCQNPLSQAAVHRAKSTPRPRGRSRATRGRVTWLSTAATPIGGSQRPTTYWETRRDAASTFWLADPRGLTTSASDFGTPPRRARKTHLRLEAYAQGHRKPTFSRDWAATERESATNPQDVANRDPAAVRATTRRPGHNSMATHRCGSFPIERHTHKLSKRRKRATPITLGHNSAVRQGILHALPQGASQFVHLCARLCNTPFMACNLHTLLQRSQAPTAPPKPCRKDWQLPPSRPPSNARMMTEDVCNHALVRLLGQGRRPRRGSAPDAPPPIPRNTHLPQALGIARPPATRISTTASSRPRPPRKRAGGRAMASHSLAASPLARAMPIGCPAPATRNCAQHRCPRCGRKAPVLLHPRKAVLNSERSRRSRCQTMRRPRHNTSGPQGLWRAQPAERPFPENLHSCCGAFSWAS